MQQNDAETKTKWQLTSPFAFEDVLEYWVQQFCGTCGRGNIMCVYGQSIVLSQLTTNKQWTTSGSPQTAATITSRNKFQQLYDCWNGTFCVECGRGGFTLPCPPEFKENLHVIPQNGTLFKTTDAGPISTTTLHRILRDWVLCGCVACGRSGNATLRLEMAAPIPLELVMTACRGASCRVCGRGMSRSYPSSYSYTHAPPPVQTETGTGSLAQKHGLVAAYLQQKRKR